MLIVTDIYGNTEGVTGYKTLKRYRNVSGEKTLSFLLLPTEQNAHSFPLVQEESLIEFDGELYRIKQMNEKPRGKTKVKEVVAIRTLFDLINSYKYETHTGSLTFQAALQFVFSDTGYTWSIVDSFLAEQWENFGDDNKIALFQEILNRYGAEFTLNNKHFTFKKQIGNLTDFQFRYNYNVKTLNRSVKTNNLSTYIKGFGKDGLTAEHISPNAAKFINEDSSDGYYHAKPVRDERYTTQAGLIERLKAEIRDEPEIAITVDFADMRRAGFPNDIPNEGDDVFLIYEPLELDVEARIMEVDEEFIEGQEYPTRTNVTLANYRNNFTREMVNYKQTQKQVNKILDGSAKLPYSVLDDAVKRATEALQSAQTELEFENGIIARSKDNPNHLVLLTSAGIGISLDGGTTFGEAITGFGVNTSLLTAGQIHTNNIQIIGDDDLFYWDGNQLIAINEADPNKYVKLNSAGLEVRKGMIDVERDDGLKTLIGGKVNQDFNLQGSDPPHLVDAVVNGRFFETSSMGANGAICNLYTFTRIARYLVFQVAIMSQVDTAQSRVIVTESGLPDLWLGGVSGFSTTEEVKTFYIDLGIPDGSVFAVQMRLKTYQSDSKAYCRTIRAYQTDFLPQGV